LDLQSRKILFMPHYKLKRW